MIVAQCTLQFRWYCIVRNAQYNFKALWGLNQVISQYVVDIVTGLLCIVSNSQWFAVDGARMVVRVHSHTYTQMSVQAALRRVVVRRVVI